jgi:3-(3-hydroxy-phenyl)propionate hydroxylase
MSARQQLRGPVIAGAGPVGLATALALARQDIPVTVLEAEADLPYDLRASTLHCATLDLLAEIGVTERLMEVGYQVRRWHIRDRKDGVVAEWDLHDISEDTAFPFRIACEQHKLARIVLTMLADLPHVSVRFQSRLTGVRQDGDDVVINVQTPEGTEEIGTKWLIGADGGRSAVRKAAQITFEGFTWPEQFLGVATDRDFEPKGFAYSSYIADPVEWAALFKVPHEGPPGVWRAMFPVDPDLPSEAAVSDSFVEERMQGLLPYEKRYNIVYRNLYRVHQRVAASFRKGRVILVGDAAHVNNPVGALGLNSGLHDAMNLSEKFAATWHSGSEDLLDRYARQRRTISVESIQADSIRNKRLLEERDDATRKERLDEIRRVSSDRKRAREYLLNSSMIESLRKANAIA